MLVSVSGARSGQSSLLPSMAVKSVGVEMNAWMKKGLGPLQFPAPLVQDKQTQKQLRDKVGVRRCAVVHEKLFGAPNHAQAIEEHESSSPTSNSASRGFANVQQRLLVGLCKHIGISHL